MVSDPVVHRVDGSPRHGPFTRRGGLGVGGVGLPLWEHPLDRAGPGADGPAAPCGSHGRHRHAHRPDLGGSSPGLPAQQILAGGPGTGSALARNLLDGIVATDPRELSGIWSTASGALAGFRSEQALEATSAPNFDAGRFVRSSDTIYIAAPAHLQAQVAPLVVGLIEDVRHATYARAAHQGFDSRSAPPVLLALDEVANVARCPVSPP